VRILQFGEGNFLRAFAGDFIELANAGGFMDAGVAVVKPRPGDVSAFARQGNRYNIILRGAGRHSARRINCVSRAISPYTDYDLFLEYAESPDLRFVISNTTEAGIVFDGSDRFEDSPNVTFPGKMTAFLYRRWRHFGGDTGRGLIFLPCELIERNGALLKEYILRYAGLWGLGGGFAGWVGDACIFCDTLVDRIVTGYPDEMAAAYPDDKLLAAAEPYALWVICGDRDIRGNSPYIWPYGTIRT